MSNNDVESPLYIQIFIKATTTIITVTSVTNSQPTYQDIEFHVIKSLCLPFLFRHTERMGKTANFSYSVNPWWAGGRGVFGLILLGMCRWFL